MEAYVMLAGLGRIEAQRHRCEPNPFICNIDYLWRDVASHNKNKCDATECREHDSDAKQGRKHELSSTIESAWYERCTRLSLLRN